jgi:hypothetical protein
MTDMKRLIESIENLTEKRGIGYRTKEFGDRKLQRHIESSVKELRSLAQKGSGRDVASREQKIFDALTDEMKRNPMNFLMSMLNVLGAGGDYKRQVRSEKSEGLDESISQGAIDRLIEAMLYNPRVGAMLKRFGVSEGDLTGLMEQVIPVVKLWLSGKGQRVAGASTAKADVRSMAK